jgi:hypothetical protein
MTNRAEPDQRCLQMRLPERASRGEDCPQCSKYGYSSSVAQESNVSRLVGGVELSYYMGYQPELARAAVGQMLHYHLCGLSVDRWRYRDCW